MRKDWGYIADSSVLVNLNTTSVFSEAEKTTIFLQKKQLQY